MPGQRNSISAVKWVALGALLLYTCLMGVWAAARSSSDVCRGVKIEVKGHPRNDSVIEAGVMTHLLKYMQPKGQSRAKLNTKAIEEWISTLNNLENVEVGFDSSGMLLISVTPLVPEMRVFTPDGGSYYVNAAGKHMDAKADFFADVPIVSGRFGKTLTPLMVRPVIKSIQDDKTMQALVTMIEVKTNGDILLVPRFRGHVINIGDTNNLTRKFANLKAFYTKVMPYSGWDTYDTISVKFRNQIVATRANKHISSHGALILEEDADTEEAALEGANLDAGTPAQAPPAKNENAEKQTPSKNP